MIRKAVRSAIVLFAALAISLALSAAPGSAHAATNKRLCETSGNYCLGSDSLNLGTAVTEKLKSNGGGRNFILMQLSGTCCGAPGEKGFPQVEIAFDNVNSPGGCVAAADNSETVVIHACTGGLGVVWGLKFNANNHMEFINREFSNVIQPLLEGHNDGSQYVIGQTSAIDFWNFDFV